MKAGDKVIWTTQDGDELECEIIAVFSVEDAVNKSMIGEKVYRLMLGEHTFHTLGNTLKLI